MTTPRLALAVLLAALATGCDDASEDVVCALARECGDKHIRCEDDDDCPSGWVCLDAPIGGRARRAISDEHTPTQGAVVRRG